MTVKRPLLKAEEHARHFVQSRLKQIVSLQGTLGQSPVVVSPYDAELGHWWFEGSHFLDQVVRQSAGQSIGIQTRFAQRRFRSQARWGVPASQLPPRGASKVTSRCGSMSKRAGCTATSIKPNTAVVAGKGIPQRGRNCANGSWQDPGAFVGAKQRLAIPHQPTDRGALCDEPLPGVVSDSFAPADFIPDDRRKLTQTI